MELLSMFITQYRGMEEQALHFSTRYIINYSRTQSRYIVSIKNNPAYIENFFGYEHITSVTGLIGQNGAGKTNTLDFIVNNLANGEGDIAGYHITVVELNAEDDNISDEKRGKIYCPLHWIVTLEDETNLFELIFIRMEKDTGIVEIDPLPGFEQTSIVFFSNIFDGRVLYPKEGMVDISTNFLIRNDKNAFTSLSQIEAFTNQELLRQLYFLTSEAPSRGVPFALPTHLMVSIFREDAYAAERKFEEFGLSSIFKALTDTTYVFHRISGYEELFLTEVYIAVFFNFVRQDFERSTPLLREIVGDLKIDDNILQQILQFFHGIMQRKNHPYREKVEDILDFLDLASYMIEANILQIGGQLPSYPLWIDRGRFTLWDFIRQYNKAKSFGNFLYLEWDNLSSGQQSWLSIFSRFYGLSDEANEPANRLRKTIFILIDEGDLYFHPEWQRKFFKMIVDFVATTFTNHKLQLIMTSNSPFIVSDLPKSHINFINKERKILPMLNRKEETFASNIHTLFADSFFMEEAMIGDFAKEKLDEIIGYLLNNEFSQTRTNYYRSIISLIGEPVIKYKIEEMWIDKLGRQEEILILENRLKKLKDENN